HLRSMVLQEFRHRGCTAGNLPTRLASFPTSAVQIANADNINPTEFSENGNVVIGDVAGPDHGGCRRPPGTNLGDGFSMVSDHNIIGSRIGKVINIRAHGRPLRTEVAKRARSSGSWLGRL